MLNRISPPLIAASASIYRSIAMGWRPLSSEFEPMTGMDALVIPPLSKGGFFDRFAKSLHLSKFVPLF
jgi:hypothetical protein